MIARRSPRVRGAGRSRLSIPPVEGADIRSTVRDGDQVARGVPIGVEAVDATGSAVLGAPEPGYR